MTSKNYIKLIQQVGLDEGVAKTLLFAVKNNFDISYFPTEYIDLFLMENVKVETEGKFNVDEGRLKQFVGMFPTHEIKPGNGYAPYRVSGNLPECRKKFKTLFRELTDRIPEAKEWTNEHLWNMIIAATQLYIDKCKADNWKYIKRNFKFIKDESSGSMLTDYIERVIKPKAVQQQSERRSYII